MIKLRKLRAALATIMAVVMLVASMPLGAAQAALVGTGQIVEKSAIDADRAHIAAFLSREDIRRQMQAMDVNADEAARRVAMMSDAEVRDVAARIGKLPAGQATVAGEVLGVLLVIFIIFVVTDLLGATDIFPFIKPLK